MRLVVRYALLLSALLLLSFALPRMLPGDPLAPVSGGGGQDAPVVLSDHARAELRSYYALDLPWPRQLVRYVWETAHGDLGFSISRNRPVAQLILDRAPWTLALAGASLLLASGLGCLLGAVAAWKDGRRGTSGLSAALLLLGSVPDFVTGIVLILLFGVWLPLLPASGAITPFQSCTGPAGFGGCAIDAVSHALLPVLALATAQLCAFFLLMRAAMLAEVDQAYVTAARARGLKERTVALRHAGRNAVRPVIALLGLRLGSLLGGAVVVETLFAYPGLGRLTFQAALARDFPLVQALVLLSGVVILLCNALADFVSTRLDPRLLVEAAA